MNPHPTSVHRAYDHAVPAMARNESRTRIVAGVTLVVAIVEIVAGRLTNSMALTADGWHMASHCGAFLVALLGYWFARSRAEDRDYSFGTGKVFALAGYTNAVALGLVSVLMAFESVDKLIRPEIVAFEHALPVAVFGLIVNLVSALLLHDGSDAGHDHAHEHGHDHGHDHGHAHAAPSRPAEDHNLRSAYFHVLADALTSVLAIAALGIGAWFGLMFLDPLMGLVGGVIVGRWALLLLRDAGRQLLDVVPSAELIESVRASVEGAGGLGVADLHLWEIGPGRRACIVTVLATDTDRVEHYRQAIQRAVDVCHLTVEVRRPDHAEAAC